MSRSGISPRGRTKPSWQALSQQDAFLVKKIIIPWEILVQILPPCRLSWIKSLSSLITICLVFPHRQRRRSTPRVPSFLGDLHTYKDRKDKENAPSTSASPHAAEALALL